VTVHAGAGAYECGEETALLDSLEGFRGQPRLKPPFPAIAGLYACPTVVNNVESIASVPYILRHGAAAFAALGTERSKGFGIFSLTGHVTTPGQYEAPLGVTLRELLDLDKLLDICDTILGRAFCPFGDGAISPVVSSIKYFRDEFIEHFKRGGCPFDPAAATVWANGGR